MNPDKQGMYPMLVVEQITGLTRRQIRYLESKGLIKPARTPGRHRLYSLADVDMLLLIKELREQGMHSLEEVKRLLATRYKKGVSPELSINRPHDGAQVPESDADTYFRRHQTLVSARHK